MNNLGTAISALARFGLAGVWLWSGFVKLLNPLDTRQAIAAYELVPVDFLETLAVLLPAVELILGLMLLLGVFIRCAGVISALIIVAFLIGIGSAWARGLTIDCGCFGGGGQNPEADASTYVVEMLRDLVFLAMAGITVWRPFTRLSVHA
ncbi:DoxX family membrane protein [Corynebacterium sp. TAE3-ERU12]|uniref:MauE/DoxX family redox-associated membrane protein n=1 Tax=Corynebacterium sp. TAE3-ERU12 TaxID=2849491 RepID=UPI001C479C5B|nr:DoxX family membrane protein [Corynebacterium sp. TAE3-ERU12]